MRRSAALLLLALVLAAVWPAGAGAQADPIRLTLETTCNDAGGRIDATITSDFAEGSTPVPFTAELVPAEVPPRGVFLAPGAVWVETWTARPDGAHQINVVALGFTDSATTVVDCVGIVEEIGGGGSSLLCLFALSACAASGVAAGLGNAVDAVAEQAGAAVLGSIQTATAEAVGWVLRSSVGWWVNLPSVVSSNTAVVAQLQGQFRWISGAMVVLGIMVQGLRLIVTRRADAGADVVSGLATVSFVSAAGWVVVSLFSAATDQWAAAMLGAAVANPAAIDAVVDSLIVLPPWATVLVGLVMFLAGIAQAILAVFRDAAVILMSGLLPFAASARLFGWGRSWLPRLTNALLALMLYKPIAAACLASALYLIGSGGGVVEVITGAAMLVGSVFALPALMRLFSFVDIGGGVVRSGGAAAGGALASGALVGAQMLGRSGASGGAVAQSSAMTSARSAGGAGSSAAAAAPLAVGAAVTVQGAKSVAHKAEQQVDTGGQR